MDLRGNLSLLIDEFYTGPWQIGVGEMMMVERDIIIDTVINTTDMINFRAGGDIIFTENGGINNIGGEGVNLEALGSLRFSDPMPFGTPTIHGTTIVLQAHNILGGENALIAGDMLGATAYNGFSLRTEVGALYAQVEGKGDLKVDAVTSIALADVNVFNGDLEVTSGGSINASNVIIQTDSYANRLALTAVGEVAFGGEQEILIGRIISQDLGSEQQQDTIGTRKGFA